MAKVTIWHNPSCSTSRKTLALLKEKGVEPEIYLYLEEKPSADEIKAVLKKLKMKPSQLLRAKEPQAKDLGLTSGADEDAILAAMADNSRLIERPVIITPKGAVIARPIESVEDVL
ncbi:MAG: arsenate reductase (glutaredoxin) [Hyphomonadaceae bacterium]